MSSSASFSASSASASLCWLLFTLAVYALPFFAGLTAGFAAFHSGSGADRRDRRRRSRRRRHPWCSDRLPSRRSARR